MRDLGHFCLRPFLLSLVLISGIGVVLVEKSYQPKGTPYGM